MALGRFQIGAMITVSGDEAAHCPARSVESERSSNKMTEYRSTGGMDTGITVILTKWNALSRRT